MPAKEPFRQESECQGCGARVVAGGLRDSTSSALRVFLFKCPVCGSEAQRTGRGVDAATVIVICYERRRPA